MKNALKVLSLSVMLLLTSCGDAKSANVDLYKTSRIVSINSLTFDFGLPYSVQKDRDIAIFVSFSAENKGSRPFKLIFTTKPYFYRESDNVTYEITASLSSDPTSYVIESGESKSFTFRTVVTQTVIVIDGGTEGYCFAFTYNDNFSINYHLYDKPAETNANSSAK